MEITVANRRSKPDNLRKKYGEDIEIIDVTSKGEEPWVRFSPFYAHGRIPVPLSDGVMGQTVEGIWQALKVFESEDVDLSKLEIVKMKGIKRTVRRLGRCLGHRAGVDGEELLAYLDARKQIYLPSYHWILENSLTSEVDQLHSIAKSKPLILLDYTTNGDVENLKTPLSHASVIASWLGAM